MILLMPQVPVKLDAVAVKRARQAGLSIQKICKDALIEKSEIMERATEKKNV
jgi:hypothetical protein